VVRESDRYWGYAANRILFAMVAEADRVVAEGIATREQVDALMCDAYSWPPSSAKDSPTQDQATSE
jgi:3-hydroxybutyryl-CoA dehydrogenase